MYVYYVGMGYMHLGQQVHYHTIISEFGVCCQTVWTPACGSMVGDVILYAVYWVEREASNDIEVALNIEHEMWLVHGSGQVPR